ncbi:MAG: sulfatase [Halodesulfurarchaeum sp.]
MTKNIVLLVMDTARAANCSCYGYDRETTPFLEELAEEGTTYERCYAQAPWTLPSHYSFFTGEYPSDHGKLSKEDRGGTDRDTLPEILSRKGYTTIGLSSNAYVSKMYGFDEMFDEFHFNSPGQDLLFPDDEIFHDLVHGEEEWDSTARKYIDFVARSVRELSPKSLLNGAYYLLTQKFGRSPDWGDDGALFVEERVKEKNIEEPFFLFVNYVEPHFPYMPPEEYAERWLDHDLDKVYDVASVPPHRRLGTEDEEAAEILQALYDAELRYLDDRIRELHRHLEEATDRDTIFIVTSDHGEFFGENGLWEHHGGLGEEVLHVPLVTAGGHDDGGTGIVELRDLFDYIQGIPDGEETFQEREEVLAEYLGIGSHVWEHDFGEYDRCVVARRDIEGLDIVTEAGEGDPGRRVRKLQTLKGDETDGLDI